MLSYLKKTELLVAQLLVLQPPQHLPVHPHPLMSVRLLIHEHQHRVPAIQTEHLREHRLLPIHLELIIIIILRQKEHPVIRITHPRERRLILIHQQLLLIIGREGHPVIRIRSPLDRRLIPIRQELLRILRRKEHTVMAVRLFLLRHLMVRRTLGFTKNLVQTIEAEAETLDRPLDSHTTRTLRHRDKSPRREEHTGMAVLFTTERCPACVSRHLKMMGSKVQT
jgi:hypothetical protein